MGNQNANPIAYSPGYIQRLSSYIDFKVGGNIFYNYLTVNNIRLYYRQNKRQKFEQLSKRYKEITQQDYIFKLKDIIVDGSFLIEEIIPTKQLKRSFENLVNKRDEENNNHKDDEIKLLKLLNLKIKEESYNLIGELEYEAEVQKISLNGNFEKEFKKEKQYDYQKERRVKKDQKDDGSEEDEDSEIHFKGEKSKYLELNFISIIKINNNQQFKSDQLKVQLNKFSTIKEVLKLILDKKEMENYAVEDLEIYDDLKGVISKEQYELSLQKLQISGRQFSILILSGNRYVSGDTPILVEENSVLRQMPIQQLVELAKQGKASNLQLVSLNLQFNQVQPSNILSASEHQVNQFYQITFSSAQQISKAFTLTCTEKCLLLDWKFRYIEARDCQKGDQFYFYDETFRNGEGRIQIIEIKQVKQTQTFYTLSSNLKNYMLHGGIVAHNQNSFQLKCIELKNGLSNVSNTIHVLKTTRIKEHFKDQKCFVAGTQLNAELTFGDYQINVFKQVFLYAQEEYEPPEWQKIHCQKWNGQEVEAWILEGGSQIRINKSIEQNYLCIHGGELMQLEDLAEHLSRWHKSNMNKNLLVETILVTRAEGGGVLFYWKTLPMHPSHGTMYEEVELTQSQYHSFQLEIQAKNLHSLTLQEIIPIYFYTSNRMYRQFNQSLREKRKQKKWLQISNAINHSLHKLDYYRQPLFRGVKDMILTDFITDGCKYITFDQFTSCSKQKSVAQRFARPGQNKGVLFHLNSCTGRDITIYSKHSHEEQVLLQPSTYWKVLNFKISPNIDEIFLLQIPMPKKNLHKIIYWVDDNPSNNDELIKNKFNEDIEIIQIISTEVMRFILEHFFWMFRILGKKVILISDMDRNSNPEAGADLFDMIFNEFGFSNRAILFVKDRDWAVESLKKRNIQPHQYFVTTSSLSLIAQVECEFERV